MPAVLVRRGGDRLLFDCGEGTQRQLLRSVGLADLDDVFLTHFHADHWLGLPGLLKTFDLRDRDRPLTVFGPTGLHQVMGALKNVYGRTRYPLKLAELEPGGLASATANATPPSPAPNPPRRPATPWARTNAPAASTPTPPPDS